MLSVFADAYRCSPIGLIPNRVEAGEPTCDSQSGATVRRSLARCAPERPAEFSTDRAAARKSLSFPGSGFLDFPEVHVGHGNPTWSGDDARSGAFMAPPRHQSGGLASLSGAFDRRCQVSGATVLTAVVITTTSLGGRR